MRTMVELMTGVRPVWAPEGTGDNGGKVEDQVEVVKTEEAKPEAKVEEGGVGATETEEKKEEPVVKVLPKKDWKDGRIAELTARLRKAEAKPAPEGPKTLDPTTDFDQRVAAASAEGARRLAAQKEFTDACNKIGDTGRTTYGKDEFNEKITQLLRVAGIDPGNPGMTDPAAANRYNAFLINLVNAADEPERVMFELGGDPDEFSRVLSLNPVQMTKEIVKRGLKSSDSGAKGEDTGSALPKPITPVSDRGIRHGAISASDPVRADSIDTPTWMRRRQEEVDARNARR